MSKRLIAKYTSAFTKDLKKKAKRRQWNLQELENIIDLIIENSVESRNILASRHNMHKLTGNWKVSNECHVANAGDWLIVWTVKGNLPIFNILDRTTKSSENKF